MQTVKAIKSLLLILAFSAAQPALGGEVKRTSKKKGVVLINEGSDQGLKKGDTVCFTDRKDKEVACGKIAKVAPAEAFVRVKKSAIKKVRKGMQATVTSGGAGMSARSSAGKSSSKTTASPASSSGMHRRNVRVGYSLAPTYPATYGKLTFVEEANAAGTEIQTYWSAVPQTKLSPVTASLGFEFGIGWDLSLALGGRYRMYWPFKSQLESTGYVVEVTESASAIGGWLDAYVYELAIARSFLLRFAAGVDYDMSKVTVSAVKQSDDGSSDVFAEATSSLSVISVRILPELNYFMNPIGVSFSVPIMIPTTSLGNTFAASVAEGPNSEQESLDLEEALAHTKTSFAVEFLLTTYISF